jgi:flavin-binding protein dodecin
MPRSYVGPFSLLSAGSQPLSDLAAGGTSGILTGMTNRTYRVTEIVGTSPDSIEQAVRNGVERASRTLRHLDWFEVTQVRGQVKDGAVEHFQVGLKVGFRLEDD